MCPSIFRKPEPSTTYVTNEAAAPVNVFSQASNPSAASAQTDLAPEADALSIRGRKKGRSALKIDRASTSSLGGASGVNIPQA